MGTDGVLSTRSRVVNVKKHELWHFLKEKKQNRAQESARPNTDRLHPCSQRRCGEAFSRPCPTSQLSWAHTTFYRQVQASRLEAASCTRAVRLLRPKCGALAASSVTKAKNRLPCVPRLCSGSARRPYRWNRFVTRKRVNNVDEAFRAQ